LEEVERSVEAAGGWERIESIAVGLGPGSFTGLRVGISTARALGASAGLPVLGAGSLDAIAAGLRERAGEEGMVLAAIDARRGEVFASLHEPSGKPVWGPWVGSPQELGEKLSQTPETALAGGSGAIRFRGELAARGIAVPDDDDPVHRVSARHVCDLAATGPADRPLDPIYLRPPDAERWRERDSADRNK
jgi:tRNA threonylcarbamoyladenosine biosynthesis protein TsaB